MSLISIVIPVYFNAESLQSLSIRLLDIADSQVDHDFEFIYVDDGSKDDSFSVLCDLAKSDNRIRVIKLVRNFGSNIAVLSGLTYAEGDCVGFIAADLQDPPEMLPLLIEQWEAGHPVVLAVRKDRQGDPIGTRIFSYIFNFLFKKLVYPDFSPQGIGFFVIDRKVVDVIVQSQEKNSHLIGLILWTGFPYTSVSYIRVERASGKSGWTFQKKLKYFLDAFVGFSYLPLRLTSGLGILFAILGGLYAIFLIVNKLINNINVPGWTALVVITLFLSGIQLIMLGVIGEYLWRNLDASRKRPSFIVDRVVSYD